MNILETLHRNGNHSRSLIINSRIREKILALIEPRKAEIQDAALLLRKRINWAVRELRIGAGFLDEETEKLINIPEKYLDQNDGRYHGIFSFPIGSCGTIAKIVHHDLLQRESIEEMPFSRSDLLAKHTYHLLDAEHDGSFGKEFSDLIQDLYPLEIIPRVVHGIMDDSYFHNLIQIGPYFLDMASDTVRNNPLKVKFDTIESFDFSDINSYSAHAEINEKYRNLRVYKNTLFPNIAPMYPYVAIDICGRLSFCGVNFNYFDVHNHSKSAEKFLF
jgi:hypothetical protein